MLCLCFAKFHIAYDLQFCSVCCVRCALHGVLCLYKQLFFLYSACPPTHANSFYNPARPPTGGLCRRSPTLSASIQLYPKDAADMLRMLCSNAPLVLCKIPPPLPRSEYSVLIRVGVRPTHLAFPVVTASQPLPFGPSLRHTD